MADFSAEAALDSAIHSVRLAGLNLSSEIEALLRQSVAERWPHQTLQALLLAEAQGRPLPWPGEVPRKEWKQRWAKQTRFQLGSSPYNAEHALAILEKLESTQRPSSA